MIALSHQYGKQFKHIQKLDETNFRDPKSFAYSKGAAIIFDLCGYEFLFVIELRLSLDLLHLYSTVFKILLYSMINNSISVRLYFSVSISGAESPKAPAPLGMESGAILTHRLPLPPCLIINMPDRMLDYISKGPKTRLDMLAGQLE